MIFFKGWAFLKKDWRNLKSYRLAFAMQFLGIFFSVAIFFFISRLVGGSVNPYLKSYGGDYFSFVLIGIAFTGFLHTGLNTFSTVISGAQGSGTLEAMLVTPTKISEILLCSSLWSFLMTGLNALVYLLFGIVFFGFSLGKLNILSASLVFLLTLFIFSSLGIISASFIMVLKRGDPISWLFGSFSSLVGGTYFPVNILPLWLQKVSYLIPLFYSLRAMRLAVLQGYSVGELLPEIGALFGFAFLLIPLSLFSFKKALIRAKIDGSLVTY
jgi:ABC-2 type transport system permease protein